MTSSKYARGAQIVPVAGNNDRATPQYLVQFGHGAYLNHAGDVTPQPVRMTFAEAELAAAKPEHEIRLEAEIARKAALPYATALVITAPTPYVDRTLATASWWDSYELHPGTYPIDLTTIDGRPVRDGERPYYARVRIAATLKETYRVNRLMGHEHGVGEQPNLETTVTFRLYAYNAKVGEPFGYGELIAPTA